MVDTVCTSAGVCSPYNSNLHNNHNYTSLYIWYAVFQTQKIHHVHGRYCIFFLIFCAAFNIIPLIFSENFLNIIMLLFLNNCMWGSNVYWIPYCHKITSCYQMCFDKYTILAIHMWIMNLEVSVVLELLYTLRRVTLHWHWVTSTWRWMDCVWNGLWEL
jgi:hypothetical protein